MTGHWRLRHKLLLSLTLVVGIILVLLFGSHYGLTSYVNTMRVTDDKVCELQLAEQLCRSVAGLTKATESGASDEFQQLKTRLVECRHRLSEYEARHEQTLSRDSDPDKGYQETGLIQDLKDGLGRYEKALADAAKPSVSSNSPTAAVTDDLLVRSAFSRIVQVAEELRLEILRDMYIRIDKARKQHRSSQAIVIGASVVGVLVMAIVVYYFHFWVFYPIRALHDGVGRVARGEFEQPIVLHSGDELEELARAFNVMTAKLHALYRDLAHQVNERSRQLVRSERMVSVGFLAAGVAHEINNPLASIAFCGEALERRLADLAGRDNETVIKYVRMIQQEAFRCKTITQRLLEFSRVGGERQRDPTDLGELIQSVLEIAQHLPSCQGKRLIFQPAGRVVAQVNGPDIKSVVLNLVVNALDSMDNNGELTITLFSHNERAVMVFADTGCGMSAEVLENIFEPFYTRRRDGKGTGLGLFISHQIIDQHHGEISAVSPGPGKGSTFTVRVPLRVAERSEEEAVIPMPSSRRAA